MSTDLSPERACHATSDESTHDWFTQDGWTVERCRDCGTWRRLPEPSCGRGCHSIEQGCPVHDPDAPDTGEREAKAAAWDEGYDAGHQAARAINPEWPEQPTNPYRAALATGTDQ